MPCNYPLGYNKCLIPNTLVKKYKIVGTDSRGNIYTISQDNSHQRFVTHTVEWRVKTLELIPEETYGDEFFRVFRFDAEQA